MKEVFAVYSPSISSEERVLLEKMMAAIGVQDFPLVNETQKLAGFQNALVFDESVESVLGVRVWTFKSLSTYLEGSSAEIGRHKKQAWDLLQKFKSEVL